MAYYTSNNPEEKAKHSAAFRAQIERARLYLDEARLMNIMQAGDISGAIIMTEKALTDSEHAEAGHA